MCVLTADDLWGPTAGELLFVFLKSDTHTQNLLYKHSCPHTLITLRERQPERQTDEIIARKPRACWIHRGKKTALSSARLKDSHTLLPWSTESSRENEITWGTSSFDIIIFFFRRRSNYTQSLAKRDGSEQNVMITNVHSSLNNTLAARLAAKGGKKRCGNKRVIRDKWDEMIICVNRILLPSNRHGAFVLG